MDPSDIFGVNEEAAALGAPGEYAAMMQPPAIDFNQYVRPAANPQELATRRSMWSQIVNKFQTDPNLQRAMMMTGAMLMQPVRPGQTTGSSAANAAVVGLNAYQMGQSADFERAMKERAEGRAERQVGIQESQESRAAGREPLERERLEAGTEGTRAATEGTRARTSLTRQQIDDAIAAAKEKKDAEPLRELERQVKEEAAKLELSVGSDQKLAARLEEMRAARVKLRAAEAELAAAEEKTALGKLTRETIEKLPENERADFFLKRGKYGSRQLTGIEAQRDVWTDMWKMKPEAERKALPLDKYLESMMLKSKPETSLKSVQAAIESRDLLGEEVPQEWRDLEAALINQMAGRAGAAPGQPAPARGEQPGGAQPGGERPPLPKQGTRENPVVVKTKEERDALPKGTIYRGPDGKLREKR